MFSKTGVEVWHEQFSIFKLESEWTTQLDAFINASDIISSG